MTETTWVILLLVLVAALVYGAFLLGRASALSQTRSASPVDSETSVATPRSGAPSPPARTPTAAPPPAMAGGEHAPSSSGTSSGSATAPPRRAAPPPAAAAGNAGPAPASTANAPRRTATPPPAAAAWSDPKSKG